MCCRCNCTRRFKFNQIMSISIFHHLYFLILTDQFDTRDSVLQNSVRLNYKKKRVIENIVCMMPELLYVHLVSTFCQPIAQNIIFLDTICVLIKQTNRHVTNKTYIQFKLMSMYMISLGVGRYYCECNEALFSAERKSS